MDPACMVSLETEALSQLTRAKSFCKPGKIFFNPEQYSFLSFNIQTQHCETLPSCQSIHKSFYREIYRELSVIPITYAYANPVK